MNIHSNKTVTVRKIRNRMILVYTLIIIVVLAGVLAYIFERFNNIAKERLAKNAAAYDLSFTTSINYFTQAAENDCTGVFGNEEIMAFDPVANSYEEYEKNSLLQTVRNSMFDLSASSGYCDFMFLYSDLTTVGRVSSGTRDLIQLYGYDHVLNLLGNEPDTWFFSIDGKLKKVFYIRKVTDDRLFVLSCYIDSLENSFPHNYPDVKDAVVLYLAAPDGQIIMTNSDSESAGDMLPEKYTSKLISNNRDCVISKDMIAATMLTECGWQAVAAIPNENLFALSPVMIGSLFIIAIIVIFISSAAGVASCSEFMLYDINNTSNEFIDPVTGVLNEYGLDEKISELLETSIIGSTYAFLLVGVKDARQIKGTLSRRYWNDIRMKLIQKTENFFFGKDFHIGRVNDDLIAAFVDFSEFDLFKAHENLRSSCEEFCKSFENFTVGSENELRLHVSIGICIYPDHAESFDDMLEKAKAAFIAADKKEDDSFVIYDPAKHSIEVTADENK